MCKNFSSLQKSISATGAYGRNWFDFFGRLPAVALCATGLMYVNELAPLEFRNDAQGRILKSHSKKSSS